MRIGMVIFVAPLNDRIQTKCEAYAGCAKCHKLSVPDALIAATAIVHEVSLYTLNVKDFHFISDLRLYQPSLG